MNKPLAQAQTRRDAMLAFVKTHAGEGAVVTPLAGDASFRRYERVTMADGTPLVLMDAPPDKEEILPFIRIAEYLVSVGLSAPRIVARDVEQGFLLLEDLGDASYTKLLAKDPAREHELYEAAVDALMALHRYNIQQGVGIEVPHYDIALLMKEVMLFSQWFLPAMMGGRRASASLVEEWDIMWQSILEAHPLDENVLVLRDYHADNLMWLPEREDVARVGQLDFQDGVVGHGAYDLVSLLEDARRDVKSETVTAMLDHYTQSMKVDREAFEAAYCLLGAQRNAKIIGIFTRLGVRDGKHHYTRYLPRVWAHFERDLSHPWLAPVRAWVQKHIPQDWRGEIELPEAISD